MKLNDKKEYINKILELYDNSELIYERMLKVLKEEAPEKYTKEMLLIKQDYYSKENMRKVLEDVLLKEDGLIIKGVYDEAIEYKELKVIYCEGHDYIDVL